MLAVLEFCKVMLVVTVSVKPELTFTDPVALPNVMELHVTLEGIVTSTPLLMITSSVAIGMIPPDQVAGAFHEPSAIAVLCAFTIVAVIISSNTIANAFVPCKIFFMPRVFKFKKGSKLVWLTTEEGYKSLYEEIGNWLLINEHTDNKLLYQIKACLNKGFK